MKSATKSIGVLLVIVSTIAATTGCVEHRYYREHHRHRPEYYRRHHQPEPRIDVNIHN
jgi:uncharacterized membrane protein YidH (DUF202 family)